MINTVVLGKCFEKVRISFFMTKLRNGASAFSSNLLPLPATSSCCWPVDQKPFLAFYLMVKRWQQMFLLLPTIATIVVSDPFRRKLFFIYRSIDLTVMFCQRAEQCRHRTVTHEAHNISYRCTLVISRIRDISRVSIDIQEKYWHFSSREPFGQLSGIEGWVE